MLAVIRARFPETPESALWSDAAIGNWLDPNILFSLAHYWTQTSFHLADMTYQLFPPVVLEDPRGDKTLGAEPRVRLVRGVLNEVSRVSDPDWDLFEQFIIWFAQPTDMFGGGPYDLKTRPGSDRNKIFGAVIDIASPFDGICQEVGHAFGLDHERNQAWGDYGCPYSTMSSSGQGTSFERPIDPRLPVGLPSSWRGPKVGDPFRTSDLQRIVGPYIPAIHFYVSKYFRERGFFHPDSVYVVPEAYEESPVTFRLDSLDSGVSSWPVRRRVLAVLHTPGGHTFFFEVRRRKDYDQGIGVDESDPEPAGLLIFMLHPQTGSIVYVDKVPFSGPLGDRDYHSFTGHFAVRLNGFDDDMGGASITVGGRDYWKHFGVDFEQAEPVTQVVSVGDWMTVNRTPCLAAPPADYQYRYNLFRTRTLLLANSFGYELPHYTWYLNDTELDPLGTSLSLVLQVQGAEGGQLAAPHDETVVIDYKVAGNRLSLDSSAPLSGIYLTVKVMVSEASPSVIKNVYPDQTVWGGLNFNNIEIEWDSRYVSDLAECKKRLGELERRFSKKQETDEVGRQLWSRLSGPRCSAPGARREESCGCRRSDHRGRSSCQGQSP